jgi:hypothetical protein
MARVTVFRCPTTGLTVQSTLTLEPDPDHPTRYEAIICPACRKVHLVNVTTGQLLSDEQRKAP